jgi:hypothetical protein
MLEAVLDTVKWPVVHDLAIAQQEGFWRTQLCLLSLVLITTKVLQVLLYFWCKGESLGIVL